MTKEILEQYWYIGKEITLIKRQLSLEENAAPQLTGDPRERERMQSRLGGLYRTKQEIEDFVDNIEDSRIRQIVTLRYLQGEEWKLVAAHFGHKESVDSVKKAAQRYLKHLERPSAQALSRKILASGRSVQSSSFGVSIRYNQA